MTSSSCSSKAIAATDFNLSHALGSDDEDVIMIGNNVIVGCSPQHVVWSTSRLHYAATFTGTATTSASPNASGEIAASSSSFTLAASSVFVVSPSVVVALFTIGMLITFMLRKLIRTRYDQRAGRPFPSSTNLPPCHVPAHPIFGHLSNVFTPPDSKKFTSIMVDNANEAGISTFWFLGSPCVSVIKAEHVRFVLRNGVERKAFKFVTRHLKRSLGQDSIIMFEGTDSDRETWRHHRNLMKTAFTTHAVASMADKVWQVASGFASSVLRECGKSDDGNDDSYRAEASDIFKWVTLDVFGAVALNHDFGCTKTLTITPLAHSLNETVEDSNNRCSSGNLLSPAHQLYWLPTRMNKEFKYHSENVHSLIRGMCQERTREINSVQATTSATAAAHHPPTVSSSRRRSEDLLTALLKFKAKSPDAKTHDDSHDELIKMLLTLFFAGYDTTSVLLSMVMWLAAISPEVQRECARESSEAGPALDEDASQWESRLAYCRAVILETLRLHPPVYTNTRNLTKDVTLDGCTVPKGTRVYLPVQQIQTDERNFARPLEFLPERWVRRQVDDAGSRWVVRDYNAEPQHVEIDESYVPPANPHNLFAFSDGARNCIGHRLALQESTIVFACLVRNLTVSVEEGFVMQKRKKFALAPPKEMPLIFRKREEC